MRSVCATLSHLALFNLCALAQQVNLTLDQGPTMVAIPGQALSGSVLPVDATVAGFGAITSGGLTFASGMTHLMGRDTGVNIISELGDVVQTKIQGEVPVEWYLRSSTYLNISSILFELGGPGSTSKFLRTPPMRNLPSATKSAMVEAYRKFGLAKGGKAVTGISSVGKIFRYEVPDRIGTTWQAHKWNVASNHHYSGPGFGGVYGGTSQATAYAEIAHYGAQVGRVVVERSVKLTNVLDLTNPQIRNLLGVTLGEISGDSYKITQLVGSWARQNGFQGILAPSARNSAWRTLMQYNLEKYYPGDGSWEKYVKANMSVEDYPENYQAFLSALKEHNEVALVILSKMGRHSEE